MFDSDKTDPAIRLCADCRRPLGPRRAYGRGDGAFCCAECRVDRRSYLDSGDEVLTVTDADIVGETHES